MAGVSDKDRTVLRQLAEKVASIASLPVQREKAEFWRRVNDLEPARPMVWINELPWHELENEEELKLACEDQFLRGIERSMRQATYLWNHMRVDMVVEPFVGVPLVHHDTGFGLEPIEQQIRKHKDTTAPARHYSPQIHSEKDVEKIVPPVVTYDAEASERNFQRVNDAIGDIIPARKRGIHSWWFAPWDVLVELWGVQEALLDLIMRPELVHMAMDRLVNAFLARLEQWEELGLLQYADGNFRVGSGGLGYTKGLPQEGFDAAHTRPVDLWGSATAQILGEVSPEMHEEFALRYERRWLERFGLTYYGCCEPLHNKAHILESIPNLRKVSVSPFADVEQSVERMGGRYVLSYKPNPAVVAESGWDPGSARRTLRKVLDQMKGCAVEVIFKDISTCCGEPRRLWEWCDLAIEEAERTAS